MSKFVFDLLEKDRKFYNTVTVENFEERITISDEMIAEFDRFLREFNERINTTSKQYKPLLRKYIKAEMIQQLLGSNVFERYLNEDDRLIEKTIQLSKEK